MVQRDDQVRYSQSTTLDLHHCHEICMFLKKLGRPCHWLLYSYMLGMSYIDEQLTATSHRQTLRRSTIIDDANSQHLVRSIYWTHNAYHHVSLKAAQCDK